MRTKKPRSYRFIVIKQKIKFQKTGKTFPFDIAKVDMYFGIEEDENEELDHFFIDKSTFQVHLNDKGEGFATVAAIHEYDLPK